MRNAKPFHWNLPAALLLAVLLAFAFTLSSHAEGVSNIREDISFQLGTPCITPGEAITFFGQAHGIARLTVDPQSGRSQEILNFQFQGQGTSTSGNMYLFHDEIANLFIFNVQAGQQSTSFFQQNFEVISQGSAPNLLLNMAGHATVNPDGTVAVFFDRFSEVCRG